MPLFSCIIPAYTVENYLEKCVQSIVNQQFKDVEILIIDDGSTDNTLAIAQNLAAQHSCIRVFHQDNAGQGAARNRGVLEAQGDFVWLIDADDWIEDGSLQYFASIVEAHNPDVIFGNMAFYEEEKGYSSCPLPGHLIGQTLSPKDMSPEDFWGLAGWSMHPFRLLAQRALLEQHNISFPSGLFYEDHPFGLRVLHAAQRMYVAPLPVYVYYQRPGSTVRMTNRRIFDFIPVRRQCLALLREWGWDTIFPQFFVSYLLPHAFYEHHVPMAFKKEFLEALKPELTDEALDCLTRQGDDFEKAKFLLLAVRHRAPWLYSLLIRFKKAMKAITAGRYIRQKLAACLKLPFRLVRTLRRRLQGAAVRPHLFACHPSVDLGNCAVHVRKTDRNAPYIYAEEGAILRGSYIFERGIGHVNIGWRGSVGGGCIIICSQAEGIRIGAQVMISWGCTLMDTNAHVLDAHARCNDEWYWNLSKKIGCPGLFKDWTGVKSAPIIIEDFAWIGCNSIILAGVTVGKGAIVGAGSVVSCSVPPYTIYAGNPAQFIKLAPRREGWRENDVQQALTFGAPQNVVDAIENAVKAAHKQGQPAAFAQP